MKKPIDKFSRAYNKASDFQTLNDISQLQPKKLACLIFFHVTLLQIYFLVFFLSANHYSLQHDHK